MTEFELKHGLSQDAPGPLEPVELAQQPGAAPATGNTARDQEMYAAGLEMGEANAKHNAAIRAAAGWLPIESAPKDGTEIWAYNGEQARMRWVEGECYALWIWADDLLADADGIPEQPTYWQPVPAAPGLSTVEDERRPDACPRCDGSGHISVPSDNSPDAREVDVCCDHCQGSGAAVVAAKYLAAALAGEKYRHMQLYSEYKNFHRSLCARFGYGHDEVHFRRDLVSLEEAIAAMRPAPAAGDALDAADAVDVDWQLMRETAMLVRDRFSAALSIAYASSDATRSAIRRAHETYEALLAMLDAAIAAQRKGYA
ncbi:hypothetical protein [Achromobacter xylosoxidans]|uniref:hypothetical protein n=1 Tax=Alcaligenes xylosoxydans xylosoxydans TaxID=85698 RepID=UPI001F10EB65|nr:hypothetical protein [Achromobacter xylosoxidans]MCH4572213.1 hypothetical protein [Achromobacter xylosoxidans]